MVATMVGRFGREHRMLEQWDLWFPSAAATGVSFARSLVEADAAGERLLVHAAPPQLDVTVRGEDWPTQDDLGRLVILPGGEAGILQGWWHAEDHSEWRWQIELYNHV